MDSLIRSFIKEHPENWEELLTEKKIKIKRDGGFIIFNYDVGADFSDPIVCEARGIILSSYSNLVVCWPFNKFFNWSEPYAADIYWRTAKVQEKIDGSIIKMWWYDGLWRLSTMSTINADNAEINGSGVTFGSIIRRLGFTDKNGIGKNLDPDYTYIFELVSPYNQVVIRYDKPKIYHIGTRNKWTGEEIDADIGIEKPKTYPLASLDDCVKAAEELNHGAVRYEGFVVVDSCWRRIKIKSPDYLVAHKLKANNNVSKDYIMGLLETITPEAVDILCTQNPYLARYLRYYQWQIEEIKAKALYIIDYARALYEENNHSRKAVALNIGKDRFAAFGFKALDTDLPPEEVIKIVGVKKYAEALESPRRDDVCD